MPMWTMDDWQYLERQVVTDPKGRQWAIGLMDILGQKGDPDRPSDVLQLQYSSGRYFTLIYTSGGTQWEHGYPSLPEAKRAYDQLVLAVIDGRVDPAQPVFRENLED